MYDDKYRQRFITLPAATHSETINSSPNGKDVLFTHVHNHKDFEILIIKSGKARFTVDGKDFFADCGDVILINPYEIHSSYALAAHLPLSFYCITFDLSLLLTSPIHPAFTLCENLSAGVVKFSNLIKNDEISSLFLKIEKIFSQKETSWEFIVSSYIFRIFAILTKTDSLTYVSSPTKNHIFTANVRKYIEENLSENITSADAAKALSYDNSYFCRLFKKNFGQSFGKYLNFCRINFAKELLQNGLSVSESALSAGFNTLSYFTKVFKEFTGTLPSLYRE